MLEIGCAWSKGSGERLQGHHALLLHYLVAVTSFLNPNFSIDVTL